VSKKGLERALRGLDARLEVEYDEARGTARVRRRAPSGERRLVLTAPKPEGSGDEILARLRRADTWNQDVVGRCEESERRHAERTIQEREELGRSFQRDVSRLWRNPVSVSVCIAFDSRGRVIRRR